MELRTTFPIRPSESKISYRGKIVFIGSCFAGSIGNRFEHGHIPVLINPFGTVYNPVSVCTTLDAINTGKVYVIDDLYKYQNHWISFDHYTDFSSGDPHLLLERINSGISEAGAFLSNASHLFITFGTARIYRWKSSGRIVSNCHKVPGPQFINELLSVNEIVRLWSDQLDKLHSSNPDLKVIFTVSPVRHLKDGAHGNQVSKSALFLAIEELQKHRSAPEYFPAYELVMDDLRDYRFYENDMLHPSPAAIDYIWEKFTERYFEEKTTALYQEILYITKAVSHRIRSDSQEQITQFAEKMLERIDSVTARHPEIDLESEVKYFRDLLK